MDVIKHITEERQLAALIYLEYSWHVIGSFISRGSLSHSNKPQRQVI